MKGTPNKTVSRAKTAKDAKLKQNYKFETRNPKQFSMITNHKVPNKPVSDFVIGI